MLLNNDRFVDLSLRMLSMFVALVLVACLGLMVYRWTIPPAPTPAFTLVPVEEQTTTAAITEVSRPSGDEVLLVPGKVFRCVVNGRTTFSDRPCAPAASSAPQATH